MNYRFDPHLPPQIIEGDPIGAPLLLDVAHRRTGHDVEMKQPTSMLAFPHHLPLESPEQKRDGPPRLERKAIRRDFHLPPEPPLAGALWQGARAAVRPPSARTCAGG